MAEGEHPSQEDIQAGYEISDVNIRRILIIVAIIAIFLVLAFIFLNSFFISSKERITYQQVLEPQSKALQQLREREDTALHTYGVVDSSAGVYRIPIERAMQLEAQEAFQTRVQESGEQASD